MKCWNCGTQNQKTAKICKKCGSDLTQPQVAKAEAENSTRKSNTTLWIVLGAAAIVLIIALLFLAMNYLSKDKSAAMEATATTSVEPVAVDATGDENSSGLANPASSALKSQGEGCDYTTCAWMPKDQCVSCGGTWQDYGDESYCDCSANKWQSQGLEWCQYEGGTWLESEDRCTFQTQTTTIAQTAYTSACANLYFKKDSGDEAAYQAYRASCKNAGGVDQCWDEACSLSVCLCPNEENVPISCSWVNGQQTSSNLKCYDENGSCWLTIEPTSGFGSLSEGKGQPQVVVTTENGQTYTSVNLERDNSGCIYDNDRISCLLTDSGAFNTNEVKNIYMCMDLCCVDLEKMASGNVVVQSGDCPGSGNLEVRDFALTQGALTFKLSNSLGWKVDTLEVFLDDAKGDHWTTMECKTDSKYDNVMDCEGWAVYKSGFATLNFYYGSGVSACSVSGVRFQIPNMSRCNYNQNYCTYTDTCCSSGKTCCSCGCKSLDEDETCSDVCD